MRRDRWDSLCHKEPSDWTRSELHTYSAFVDQMLYKYWMRAFCAAVRKLTSSYVLPWDNIDIPDPSHWPNCSTTECAQLYLFSDVNNLSSHICHIIILLFYCVDNRRLVHSLLPHAPESTSIWLSELTGGHHHWPKQYHWSRSSVSALEYPCNASPHSIINPRVLQAISPSNTTPHFIFSTNIQESSPLTYRSDDFPKLFHISGS